MNPTSLSPPLPTVWLGWDWSDKEHVLWLETQSAQETITLANKVETLQDFFASLAVRFPNQKIAVGVESTRSLLVPTLMRYDFLLIYLINPKSAAQYREMFHPSGVKNDFVDARCHCQMVRTHAGELRLWQPHDAATRELTLLCEDRRQMVDVRTKLANMLQQELKTAFPGLLDLVGNDLTSSLAAAVLTKWPSLAEAQQAGKARLRKFFYAHGYRRVDILEERLERLPKARPVSDHPEDVRPARLRVLVLARQIALMCTTIKEYDENLKRALAAHPNCPVVQNLPGAALQFKSRLAAAFGTQKDRYGSAEALSSYVGVAPIQRQSGKTKITLARWIRPIFLHQTFVEFARSSTKKCDWASQFYETKLKDGFTIYQAARALAFKWQRILFVCWRDGVPYDEAKYLKSLKKKNSPYWVDPTLSVDAKPM